jgi:hypothetical protein
MAKVNIFLRTIRVRESTAGPPHIYTAAAMMAKVGNVFGTLRHPHLIQPYLAYYDHLVSHYGVLGPIPCWCD